jgi:hypothetical protein
MRACSAACLPAARSADVTASHTTEMGSWEVHSDVGFSERRRGHLVGRIVSLVGGWAEVLFWNASGANGWGERQRVWVSSVFGPAPRDKQQKSSSQGPHTQGRAKEAHAGRERGRGTVYSRSYLLQQWF